MLGIFDSGIGGLTVVKELLRRAPSASFVYLGDTARTPYGTKGEETIIRYALDDANFLINHGATALIVACNTVSAYALSALRAQYPSMPIFDVLSPAIRAVVSRASSCVGTAVGTARAIDTAVGTARAIDTAVATARVIDTAVATARVIGVLGTSATVRSGAYERALHRACLELEVISIACPLFVPLVEEGWLDEDVTRAVVARYLAPLKEARVDTVVLGCTHYPLLQPLIAEEMGSDVTIIDSPKAIMDEVMESNVDLLNTNSDQRFFFTDVQPATAAIASQWLGREVEVKKGTCG